eukprot:gene2944-5788_t
MSKNTSSIVFLVLVFVYFSSDLVVVSLTATLNSHAYFRHSELQLSPWKHLGRSPGSILLPRRSRNICLQSLPPSVVQDILSSSLALGGSIVWVEVWTRLAVSGTIDSKLARKIIHCGSAPLFMSLWPLYSSDPTNRIFASIVPFLQIIRLTLAGDTKAAEGSNSARLAATISRREALGGPLIYTIVLFLSTILFF